MIAEIRRRILGHPFVYEKIRPLVIGGLDLSPAYELLACTADDVVLDVGCGTGDALNYLTSFRAYHGFDNDPVAVAHARGRFGDRPNVHYFDRSVTADDLAQVNPTRVMMAGLLHHLDDATAIDLLRMCARTGSVRRIATQDVVYLPGQPFSNLLARFDRGKHVRNVPGYRVLVREAGWRVSEEKVVKSHPTSGRALLFLMGLERA